MTPAMMPLILTEIKSTISNHIAPSARLSADLGSYKFPQHIVATNLWPDIVCWDDLLRRVVLVEFMVCFESSFILLPNERVLNTATWWLGPGPLDTRLS